MVVVGRLLVVSVVRKNNTVVNRIIQPPIMRNLVTGSSD